MKTTENNKLIAEFMGVTLKDNKFYIDFDKHKENLHHSICVFEGVANSPIYELEERKLKFHCSWDWLMPVVEKIEDIDEEDDDNTKRFNVIIEQCVCSIIENHTSEGFPIQDGDTKIEAVYKAVVEFIKWYNNEHKN